MVENREVLIQHHHLDMEPLYHHHHQNHLVLLDTLYHHHNHHQEQLLYLLVMEKQVVQKQNWFLEMKEKLKRAHLHRRHQRLLHKIPEILCIRCCILTHQRHHQQNQH
jgi:hypothetical protein